MKKLTLGLASACAFASIALGSAGAATAVPDYVTPGNNAAHSAYPHSASIRPVDCVVHVNAQGSDVAVNWC
jgi:hypothetical protein